jgi:DNA-binding NarL/FixJ family response regulator
LPLIARRSDACACGATFGATRTRSASSQREPGSCPALAVFERLGAAGQADETAALLRSLGAAGRTATRRDGELTAREREVLALLAEGLSNGEIAHRLVITEKTAGHHVSRIFRKLGLRNRAEAAAYALRNL